MPQTSPVPSAAVPDLYAMRKRAMEHALAHPPEYAGYRRPERGTMFFFKHTRQGLEFAAWCALEFTDPHGPFAGDARLPEHVVTMLELAAEDFGGQGTVADGDLNTGYFALVPAVEALRAMNGHMDQATHDRLVGKCARLFDDAAAHINRNPQYLNPRGLEGACALGLHALTGDEHFRSRALECLDLLTAQQYPCGAQPYHTGGWVWGRKPAQVYQMLTGAMMVRMAQQLGRDDVMAYVQRIMSFVSLTTSRRGEVFVTPFEGLHKSSSFSGSSWAWPLAASVGSDSLAVATYKHWAASVARTLDGLRSAAADERGLDRPYCNALFNAAVLGVHQLEDAAPFVPKQGPTALADISTIAVHEPHIDLAATLLTGYSAFAQGEVGSVRLFALTPELTDEPTYRNAGTDALRMDWTKPSEQIACTSDRTTARLSGRVSTKWDLADRDQADGAPADPSRVHTRELEVTMAWHDSELRLDYRTTRNAHKAPVSTRMLLLMAVWPDDARARLRIGDAIDQTLPPAASMDPYRIVAPPGVVRVTGPDGAAVEITPERGQIERIVVERPSPDAVARIKDGKVEKQLKSNIKPANEGCFRLTFEGPAVLDAGCLRIRFIAPTSP